MFRLLGIFPEIRKLDRLHRALIPMNGGKRFFDVQRSALSLSVAPVPVKESEGGVAGLLNLCDQHAATDGVNCARRQKHTIACSRLKAMQTFGHLTVGDSSPEFFLVYAGTKSGINVTLG